MNSYKEAIELEYSNMDRSHLLFRFFPNHWGDVDRHTLVRKFAWAIPNDEALDCILKYSPNGVVEIGAGLGYWASLLRERSGDVVCFDKVGTVKVGDGLLTARKGQYIAEGVPCYHEVIQGGPQCAKHFPRRTLFLCWPPYDEPMGYLALKNYKGNTLIYVGEPGGGCTGCDKFHEKVDKYWEMVEEIAIEQYYAIHDELVVYRRK